MRPQTIENERKSALNWLKRLAVETQTSFLVIDPHQENRPIVFANEAFYSMTGFSEEVIGRNSGFLLGERTCETVIQEIRETINRQETGTFELESYRKDEIPYWSELTVQPFFSEQEDLLYYLLLQKDITSRKQTEGLIELQEQIYAGIERGEMLGTLMQKLCNFMESFSRQGAKCSVLLVDEDRRFRICAAASFPREYHDAINGLYAGEETGSCGAAYSRGEVVVEEDISTSPLWRSLRDVASKIGLVSCWSTPIFNSEQKAIGTFATYLPEHGKPNQADLELTEKVAPLVSLTVKYAYWQEEMLQLAFVDAPSGLRNRQYFMQELQNLLKTDREGVIVFLSVDEYTRITDQYGHRSGDQLITEIGRRLSRKNFTHAYAISRFSDSTIAVWGLVDSAGLPQFIDQLKQIADEPYSVDDLALFLTLKMGIAPVSGNEQEAEELIRYADSALSRAKGQVGEAVVYSEKEQNETVVQDLKLANDLTAALLKEEVGAYVQPKVELATGKVIGFEALARWTSDELGPVSPALFIPVAEKSGKIRLLEQQILKHVLQWLKSRKNRGLTLQQVAVNISAAHFFHFTFVTDLLNMIKLYEIEPEMLRLEITESIGFTDYEAAQEVFRQLKEYGFQTSVDDFGTGYSSLSYLQKLPVSELKIDRSFVMNLQEPETAAIVRTIIQLAENLNMVPVAEGIETEEQCATLLSFGCKFGQGFHFYRPMPLDEADRL